MVCQFLARAGGAQGKAIKRVAEAYGVDYETIRTWEKNSVPEAMGEGAGPLYFKICAEKAGEWERQRQAGEVAADAVPDNTMVHSLHIALTHQTLEELGREYKDAQRKAKRNRRRGGNIG